MTSEGELRNSTKSPDSISYVNKRFTNSIKAVSNLINVDVRDATGYFRLDVSSFDGTDVMPETKDDIPITYTITTPSNDSTYYEFLTSEDGWDIYQPIQIGWPTPWGYWGEIV